MPRATRPRRRNFNITGHAHVLTFSCFHGFKFLRAERTCQWLAGAIAAAQNKHEFDLWAYVFMPEHAHLIIHPKREAYDIARIRHAIKHPVGEIAIRHLETFAPGWLPRITRQRGAKTDRLFWQTGGGYDRNIETTAALVQEIDYIHLNPLRKGLAERAADWKWSSAGWYAGAQPNSLKPDPIPADWID